MLGKDLTDNEVDCLVKINEVNYFQIGGNTNLGKGIVKMEILFNGGDC